MRFEKRRKKIKKIFSKKFYFNTYLELPLFKTITHKWNSHQSIFFSIEISKINFIYVVYNGPQRYVVYNGPIRLCFCFVVRKFKGVSYHYHDLQSFVSSVLL